MKSARKLPALRRNSGRNTAIVTLTCAASGQRRTFTLGDYNSPQVHEAYGRLIAAWLRDGYTLTPALESVLAHTKRTHINGDPDADPYTVSMLCLDYLLAVQRRVKAGEVGPSVEMRVGMTIKVIRSMYGSTPAQDFGPKALVLVRDAMLHGDPKATPPRKPWSRYTANVMTRTVIAMFAAAVADEALPAAIHQALMAVAPLKALNRKQVHAVRDPDIEAVIPHVSPQVAALIRLQRISGARAGELLIMRPCDIDRSGDVWLFSPFQHKTAGRGHKRIVALPPSAQRVLEPFMKRPPASFCFSPSEAEAGRLAARSAARRTPPGVGNAAGTNKTDNPEVKPGDRYTTASYRRAIERACDAANITTWTPHQLRHAAATAIRRQHGLEAAQILLGHKSIGITEVYAETDQKALTARSFIPATSN